MPDSPTPAEVAAAEAAYEAELARRVASPHLKGRLDKEAFVAGYIEAITKVRAISTGQWRPTRVEMLKVLMGEYRLDSFDQLDTDRNYRLTEAAAEQLADALLASFPPSPDPHQ